ncbi:carbonic anhydrase 4 [Oncorhynchus kisutch]|uniref:carbonic anhydrase 4 n=1 Tax=Oncorhynchus kisutch TaxID=8019 RepID=UPI00099FCA79|nr:carbonic anhydrase 4 [Oncorhynchus kisutch]
MLYKWTSVCIILYLCSRAIADQPWCHNGCENSPSFWPSLPNSQCGGVRQSPINIDTNQLTFDPSLRNLTFSDITNPHSIKFLTNNGHTVSCVLEGLMEVRGGGLPHGYTAVMMHFHWGGDSLCHPGSEHTVDSVRYPMEIHLVTLKEGWTMEQAKTDPERIAVFGFFIDVTGDQRHVESWRTLTSYLLNITEKGSSVDIVQPLSISDLLGSVDLTKFYRYQGSLTTPTCDEVVVWTVFEEPIKLRRDLVEQFPKTLKYRNIYRPVQRLNGRPVYASPGVSVSPLGRVSSGQTSSRGALSPGLLLLLLLGWG